MVKEERARIVVVTTDTLGSKVAGPAIRAFEIAKALSMSHEVRLLSTESSTLENEQFLISFADDTLLREHLEWADVLIFSGGVLSMFPWIAATDLIIVADVYDPFHLESLELSANMAPQERETLVGSYLGALNLQLQRADFILCASEKQRDLWIGHLGALGRLNVQTYTADPSLRELIEVVPFGVSDSLPKQSRHAIKGSIPGIGANDKVVIWGGGVYNWFDPLTLIDAINILSSKRRDVRLFFLGMTHPNPNVPEMKMSQRTRELSDSLGLTNTFVFFNEDWVDYEDRANYLLDADLGVSTHFEHVETSFSFRTRILDYFWAGLPVVTTEGDSFSKLIEENHLGLVVPFTNPERLADAIEKILFPSVDSLTAERVADYGKALKWEFVLEPLKRFCAAPRHAPDYPFTTNPNYFASFPADVKELIDDERRNNQQLQELNSSLQNELARLEEKSARDDAALEAILTSTSWRATSFLRALRNLSSKVPRT